MFLINVKVVLNLVIREVCFGPVAQRDHVGADVLNQRKGCS